MKIIILILILNLLSCGMYEYKEGFGISGFSEKQVLLMLPNQIQNFNYLGKGWCTFDLYGNKFLYHSSKYEYKWIECITTYSENKGE